MIPALVLTAGLATRVRPLSLVRAKAAFPVGGEPLIHRILRSLASFGVRDAVLNLHHLPHTLTSLVGDGSELGMRVRYSWEVPLLGSAGGPRRARSILGAPTFLIVNGDTLATMDLRALLDQHRRSGALVTMGVVPNVEPAKYNGLLADDDGAVTGIAMKGSTQPSYHFVFVQAVEASIFEAVPADTPSETVHGFYPSLIASQPGSVRVFRTNAEYFDIGTPSDFLDTSLRFAEREGRGLLIGRGGRVHPTARIERSVLWDEVEVGEGAMLRECVVTDGVTVPADTSWHGVTLRVPNGALVPGEKRIGELAVCPI